ncbi:uncharacterized protein [Lepeophtheirus salmonis]|uniref:uncharacterized protein n=1 Tax=Lepeophtheirus salmonis TaxID=72036 RepID=UPI001AEB4EB8|nr:uncharacterized protein LOC121126624 [Lepeophtheirus salmonis]
MEGSSREMGSLGESRRLLGERCEGGVWQYMEAAGMGPAPLLAPQQSGLKVMLPGGGVRNSPHYLLLGGAGPGGLDGSGGLSPNGGVPSSLEMSERSWKNVVPGNVLLGPPMLSPDVKNVEEGFQGPLGEFIPLSRVESYPGVASVGSGNSSQGGNGFAVARSGIHELNGYSPLSPYSPATISCSQAQSSGMGSMGNMLQTMPPRPRPEGGQEQSNVFESVNEIRKDDLIIGSWDEECKERGKAALSQQYHYQQHHSNQQPMNILPPHYNQQFLMQHKMVEDCNGFDDSSNYAAWRNHTPCGRGWNSSSLNNTLNSLSTTHHQSSTRSALNGWQQPFSSNAGRSAARGRGILRGNRSRGSRSNVKFGTENDSSHRSRPHNSTHISDHLQEKKEGKKSAIAETIAMMSKMKMEDKERQVQKQSPDNDSSNSVNVLTENCSNIQYKNSHSRGSRYIKGRGYNCVGQNHINPMNNFLVPIRGIEGFLPFHQSIYTGSYPSNLYRTPFLPPVIPGSNNRGYRNCNNLYRGPPPPIMIGLSQRPHHAQGSRFPLNISYTNEGIRRCSRGRGRSGNHKIYMSKFTSSLKDDVTSKNVVANESNSSKGEDQNSENDSMERCSSTLVTD